VNDLSVRKVSSDHSYPLVRSYLEEFDNPAAYLPDNKPPYRVKVISDRIAFPADGWTYLITYTDAMRKECQRLREKLRRLLPKLESEWENANEKRASLDALGYSAYSFCTIYLAYGYLRGWEGGASEDRLEGDALRDLFLEAEDFQRLFFAGPEEVGGRRPVSRHHYTGSIHYLYTDGKPFSVPKTIGEADTYIDIWQKALEGTFFDKVSSLAPGQLTDGDKRLVGRWGAAQQADGEAFRLVTDKAALNLRQEAGVGLLIRARLGTDAAALTQSTRVRLALRDTACDVVVCKPRWFHWLLPEGATISELTIQAEKPIRVYRVDVYRTRTKRTTLRRTSREESLDQDTDNAR
jgi:hypothetical protein